MKKSILSLLGAFFTGISIAQTATNFNANDCASNNHDLFTELNSGKIVVITWVMPCTNCVGGATSAQNAVNSFSVSNPGQVLHYIADDYANTTCSVITGWCATNSLTPDAVFSNTAVSMTPYGAAGMPKVIVVGGNNHTVFYNTNGGGNITTSGIQSAINNALSSVGVREYSDPEFQAKISPNPANNEITLTFLSSDNISVEIFSVLGQKVKSFNGVSSGELKVNTESLSSGSYFAKISDGKKTGAIKFLIAH